MDVMRKIRDIKESRDELSLPDLAVDPEEWLNAGELSDHGGYRKDRKGWSWWLPEKELAMYEMTNNDPDFADDKAFWEWFDEFRVERGLKASRTSAWTYAPGVKKSYDSDSYFKSMWTGFGFGSKSGYGSAASTELATALGFVQTLIQAVRSRPGRYKVEFATEDSRERPTSYTDFENQLILISPQAALDKKLSTDKQIRITTGWALHESSHTEDTVDRWPVLFKPTLLKPPQIGSLLLNIVEDVRIEQRMGVRFPGFADYFEDSRLYLWDIGGDKKDIGLMPDDLTKMLSFIVRTIRWPDKLEPELASDEAREEFEWWKEWHATYNTLDKNPAIRTHLEKALNRLSAMFRPEMEKMVVDGEEAEKAAGRAESAIKKAIEDLVKKIKEAGKIPDPCASPSKGKDVLSREVAKEVERKLGEEWEIEKREDHAPDGDLVSNYDLLVRRPLTDSGWMDYHEDKGPMARRLRSAFVLRPARPEYADRLLRQGQVDDDELWRWGVGDFRVFEQKIRESAPDTDITLLVDESGSMGGDRMDTAKRLAQLMVSCLADMGGVNLKVRGHTGQNSDFPSGIVINKIWDPGDDQRRIGLLRADSQNMDGYAIDWCVKELQKGRGDTQKILIVIADGEPYGHGYSGRTAMNHVREVTTKAERNGVYVIQLGVGDSLQESEQKQMFNHYIPYVDDETLLRDLTKLMSKLF
jgi:hypothetical protein